MNYMTVIPTGARIGGSERLSDCHVVRAFGSREVGFVRAFGSTMSKSFVLLIPKVALNLWKLTGTRQVKI
jgi:hypothetical protein